MGNLESDSPSCTLLKVTTTRDASTTCVNAASFHALPTKASSARTTRGQYRWVVERTHVRFAGFTKLRTRFERRLDTHTMLLSLSAAVIAHDSWMICVSGSYSHLNP